MRHGKRIRKEHAKEKWQSIDIIRSITHAHTHERRSIYPRIGNLFDLVLFLSHLSMWMNFIAVLLFLSSAMRIQQQQRLNHIAHTATKPTCFIYFTPRIICEAIENV